MNTCKTCKYWGNDRDNQCSKVDSYASPILFEIEATASDDSGLEARLMTDPNFGCVLHDPRK